MSNKLTDVAITLNDAKLPYVPNTLSFTEGLGEVMVEVATAGNGALEGVTSVDVSTKIPMAKFALFPTPEAIEAALQAKRQPGLNRLVLTGKNASGSLKRTFVEASVTNDYEVQLTADGNIEIEMKAASITR